MKRTIAVIGCGRIAQNAHFPAFSHISDLRVKYACDIIIEKAEMMKKTYPFVEQAITDYKIALADHEVEAVWVLTPNIAHYTITMDALAAGKHVMCEKPVTVNYPLSHEMAKAANAHDRILNIGVCNRYNRSVEMLEEMNRLGKFGKIYHVECVFRNFRSIPGLGGAFTNRSQSGGGVLIDWGVHFLDLVLFVLGGATITSATADAYSEMAKDMQSYRYNSMWAEDTADIAHGVNDVEDYITGYVRTDKASISFSGAWAQNMGKEEMYIDFLGDKGGARLDYGGKFTFWDGTTLKSETPDYALTDMYLAEDEAFLESVATGKKNRSNIDAVLESAKLLEVLYQSAALREEVKPQ